VRPPAGLIRSPAVLGLAVGLGDPWDHCRGVAARWLDTEFWHPRAYGGGLGSCGVAAGAGCDPSCACVRVCVCACCWCRLGHQGSVKEDHVL